MCLPCVSPSGQSGCWAVAYTMGQFSKSVTLCSGSDPCMCSPGVSSALPKLLYKIASSLRTPQYFLVFSVSIQNVGAYLFTVTNTWCDWVHAWDQAMKESLKNINKCLVHLLGHRSSDCNSSSLRVFGLPLLSQFLLPPKDCLGAEMQENGEKYGGVLTFCWHWRSLIHSSIQNQRASPRSFSVLVPPPRLRSCWVQKTPKGKNHKSTTGWVTLQMLVFSPDPITAI